MAISMRKCSRVWFLEIYEAEEEVRPDSTCRMVALCHLDLNEHPNWRDPRIVSCRCQALWLMKGGRDVSRNKV
jgi:hypothetical protein